MQEDYYSEVNHSIFNNLPQKERLLKLDEIREEIRNSPSILNTILDQIPSPLYIYDFKGNLIDCNNSFEELLGYKKEDLLGKNWLGLKIMPLIQRSRAKIILGKNVQGLSSGPDEYEFITRKGKLVHVEVKTSVLNTDNYKLILASVNDYERHIARENVLKSKHESTEELIGVIYRQIEKNLQIVSSLMNLQKSYMENNKDAELLQDTHNRVKSIRKAYEKLHHSHKLTSINFSEYVKSIISGLLSTYYPEPGNIALNLELDDVLMEMDTAISLGMIISELVSNSFRHAFMPQVPGEIKVIFQDIPEKYVLKVSDNGKGFPKGSKFDDIQSLGLQLVKSLVNQMDATMHSNVSSGTNILIEVPRK